MIRPDLQKPDAVVRHYLYSASHAVVRLLACHSGFDQVAFEFRELRWQTQPRPGVSAVQYLPALTAFPQSVSAISFWKEYLPEELKK